MSQHSSQHAPKKLKGRLFKHHKRRKEKYVVAVKELIEDTKIKTSPKDASLIIILQRVAFPVIRIGKKKPTHDDASKGCCSESFQLFFAILKI